MIISGKQVNEKTIEFDGLDFSDYPDFCDSYVSYAEFMDKTALNDTELDLLLDLYSSECNAILFESLH
jgi:hypothetical protein